MPDVLREFRKHALSKMAAPAPMGIDGLLGKDPTTDIGSWDDEATTAVPSDDSDNDADASDAETEGDSDAATTVPPWEEFEDFIDADEGNSGSWAAAQATKAIAQ